LAALGIAVPASVIARWLTLIPVVALELGAALSVVLMEAIAADPKAKPARTTDDSDGDRHATATAELSVSRRLAGKPPKARGRRVERTTPDGREGERSPPAG